MGNKALRTKLAALVGPLYSGSKFAAYRYLRADRLRRLIAGASYEAGSTVHACDGFNHRVVDVETYIKDISPRSRKNRNTKDVGWVVNFIDLTFEDGGGSCCGGCRAQPALPRKEIEAWTLSYITSHRVAGTGWSNSPYHDEVLKRLEAGEHICDEDGIILPELRELSHSPAKE